ncbi:XRE family transcriptional regulator [Streptococcus pseudopneumoniae]|nr:helix-turn-helix transcriptional regulator [Streptococcus pseudopneumoniae]MBF9659915.1 helix-turn-helix transcriptional regulator [Streptococcus pseudopneumoniae]TMR50994.1 XRE family transcriptional regulator [Streptococcus pseudopneumoniae]
MNRLKELRQEKKLSQKEIAKEMSISEKTLSRWENGESQIKPEKAQQLADYFGVSVGYLLGYESNPLERLESLVDELKEHKDLLGVLDWYTAFDLANDILAIASVEKARWLGRLNAGEIDS